MGGASVLLNDRNILTIIRSLLDSAKTDIEANDQKSANEKLLLASELSYEMDIPKEEA